MHGRLNYHGWISPSSSNALCGFLSSSPGELALGTDESLSFRSRSSKAQTNSSASSASFLESVSREASSATT